MDDFDSERSRSARVIIEMAEIFAGKNVARSAAALSYYLTLSVFPLIVCVSAILGSMHIQESGLIEFLADVVPENALSTISGFFKYLDGYSSKLILSIGLVALLTSSSAAFRSFIGIMGDIQDKKRFVGIWGGVFSVVFSIALIAAVYISGLVILSGEWMIQILKTYFELGNILAHWTWIRFIILFLLLFVIIYSLYFISAPKAIKRTHRLPGAFAAAFVLLAASLLYSRMITASIRYAILYGSLASFVILMIWLYTCGIILILGNVFNVSLHKVRNGE